MVFFNYALRKLNAKIVYYGPGLCGKTTNLQWIHEHFDGGSAGKMVSLATEGDRTIFFDLLPLDIGTVRGMGVTLQLYTVPGQVHYNATRQLVLRGADGVVFVADSQVAMRESNLQSWANLSENLRLQGIDLETFPHVLQFNKRDLREVLPVDELDADLNEHRAPLFEAVAVSGVGVQETLEGIVRLVMRSLRDRYETSSPREVLPPQPARSSAPPPAAHEGAAPASVSVGPWSAASRPPEPAATTGPLAEHEHVGAITRPSLDTDPDFEPPQPGTEGADPADEDTYVYGSTTVEILQEVPPGALGAAHDEVEELEEARVTGPVSAPPPPDADTFAAPPDEDPFASPTPPAVQPAPGPDAVEAGPPPAPAPPPAAEPPPRPSEPPPAPVRRIARSGSVEDRVADVLGQLGRRPAPPPPAPARPAAEPAPPPPPAPTPAVPAAPAAPTQAPAAAEPAASAEEPAPVAPPAPAAAARSAAAEEPAPAPPPAPSRAAAAPAAPAEMPAFAPSPPAPTAALEQPAPAPAAPDEPWRPAFASTEAAPFGLPDQDAGPGVDDSPVFDRSTPPAPDVTRVAAAPGLEPPSGSDDPFAAASDHPVLDPPQPGPELESVPEAQEWDLPPDAVAAASAPEAAAPPPAVTRAAPPTAPSAAAPGNDVFGAEEPFGTPTVVAAQLLPRAERATPAGGGNQLRVRLEGTGALAQAGQVRELDIVVPVPGGLIGNQRVTLQLRLTLTPVEEEGE